MLTDELNERRLRDLVGGANLYPSTALPTMIMVAEGEIVVNLEDLAQRIAEFAEIGDAPARHVAQQTHALAKELYEKATRRLSNKFPTTPTTLMLLEHTNTMLTSVLDRV